MEKFNPISALNYGVIGLGFLLALMSFWLLRNAKPSLHKPIYVFMLFSIFTIILGISSEYTRYYFDNAKLDSANVIERLKNELSDQKAAVLKSNTARNQLILGLIAKVDEMSGNIEKCRKEAWGASTNTSDAHGCTTAAITAMNGGQTAVVQAKGIREGLSQLLAN